VVLKDGVEKLSVDCAVALVRNKVPPVLALYHLKVPAVALLAARITTPGPHVEPAVTVGAIGTEFIVAVTDLRVALSQLLLLVTVTKYVVLADIDGVVKVLVVKPDELV
jgi:hypothetical protein